MQTRLDQRQEALDLHKESHGPTGHFGRRFRQESRFQPLRWQQAADVVQQAQGLEFFLDLLRRRVVNTAGKLVDYQIDELQAGTAKLLP